MKNSQINIRVSKELKSSLTSKAKKLGMTLSQYMLYCAADDPGTVVKNLILKLQSQYALLKFNTKDPFESSKITNKILLLAELLSDLNL